MIGHPRSLFTLRIAILAALSVGATALIACGPPSPVQGINAAQTAQAQRLPVQMVYTMPPVAAVTEARGVVEITVVRTPDELGRFTSSLPKEFNFDRHMLVFQGPKHQFESMRDAAPGLRIVEANSGDIYKPGIHTTSTAMTTVIHVLLPADPCCGVEATPAPVVAPATPAEVSAARAPVEMKVPGTIDTTPKTPEEPAEPTEQPAEPAPAPKACDSSAAGWSGQLVLYAVPQAEGTVQVSIEEEPCPKK